MWNAAHGRSGCVFRSHSHRIRNAQPSV
uniref:Uncharacterized protein n=1 Tax=Arundo donax TaxID=35708 RepID=A0A0A9GXH1_ARUDO